MERWSGKVAVVTGVSSGIGLETAKIFVQNGLIVVGLARRKAQMEESMKDVKGPGKFYAKECDISKEANVIEAFNWIKKTVGTVNILINNSGFLKSLKIEDTPTKEIDQILSVNVNGLIYCSKQAIKMMKDNQGEAHIVNVNSILGHKIFPASFGTFSVYPASKFAVTALTETLKNELMESKIRVSSISPGMVRTPMAVDSCGKGDAIFDVYPSLDPIDVANSIVHIIAAPSHVQIEELTLQAKHIKA